MGNEALHSNVCALALECSQTRARLDAFELCRECSRLHSDVIRQSCNAVIQSGKIIKKSKKIDTILSRIELAQENCRTLMEYEERGIETLSLNPGALIEAFDLERTEAVERALLELKFQARQRAKDAATDAAKIGGYARAIEKISALMDVVDDATEMELAIETLRFERDGVRARLLCDKADVWLAKGKKSKAIDVLIEALMSLRQDGTPDARQSDQIADVSKRIEALGGVVPPV